MEILKVSQKNFKQVAKIAVVSIKKGKIIVCPTDTVYGLICDAKNKRAIKKLFKIKKRPIKKAIPIFVKDIKMAKKLTQIDKNQDYNPPTASSHPSLRSGQAPKFLKKVWPGKITVVLYRKNNFPKILFGKEKTIGLRIPKHPIVNQILTKINKPLTGTSANISGKPPSTKIKEVIKQFEKQKHQPDLILDAGNLKPSKPSTVIDLTSKRPKILRTGQVSKKELLKLFKQ